MTAYGATLTLAVKDGHGQTSGDFWQSPGWEFGRISRAEYASEWSWLADEFQDESYRNGTVLEYSTRITDEAEFLSEWDSGQTHADLFAMADHSARFGLDGPDPMDWNVGGITYVVDARLDVYEIAETEQ